MGTESFFIGIRNQFLNRLSFPQISYSAHKEFYDSHGVLQELPIPPQDVMVESSTAELRVDNLMPFTSYLVNITAIPQDETFRPPAKITVTTAMAGKRNPSVKH